MAIFKVPIPGRTSQQVAQLAEELAKKNRKSSTVVGYDTSSPSFMRLEGKPVTDASGIGTNVNSFINNGENNTQSPYFDPQLLDILLAIPNESLTPEQQQARDMIIDGFPPEMISGQYGQGYDHTTDPDFDPGAITTNIQTGQGSTGNTPAVLSPEIKSQNKTAVSPVNANQIKTNNNAVQTPTDKVAMPGDTGFIGPIAPTEEEMALGAMRTKALEEQASSDKILNSNLQDEIANYNLAPEKLATAINDRGYKVRSSQTGLPEATLRQNDAIPSTTTTFEEIGSPTRKFLGNAVSDIGTKLKLPELGLSEAITGATGRIAKTVADTGSKLITPSPAYAAEGTLQAGQGIDKLKSGVNQSFSDKGIAKRPSANEINPTPSIIGGTPGDTASGVASRPSAVNPGEFFNPDATNNQNFTPARPASTNQSYIPANQSSNGGQSQQSSQANRSVAVSAPASKSVASVVSKPAPAPVSTPAKTVASKATPVATPSIFKTPAVAPTPVPTPSKPASSSASTPASQPSQSLIQQVANVIKSIFKRR